MADESDPRRDALHGFLQEQGPSRASGDMEAAAVLTGWVMVCEWMDTDGERWLARGWSSALPGWSARGMMHEVLFGDWGPQHSC